MSAAADNVLIDDMSRGDAAALETLYDLYATAVFRVACRIVRDPIEAEDVVQEVFLQAWRQASRFDHTRASVVGWLLVMTRSRAIDHLRRSRTQRESPVFAGEGDDTVPVDRALAREQQARNLRHVVGTLPPVNRVLLQLSFFEGLTHAEIANVLHQPLGTVKSRIRAAIGSIRRRVHTRPPVACGREAAPFAARLSEYLAARSRTQAREAPLQGARLLVIDDDVDTAEIVGTVLRSAGAEVTMGYSTAQGLARLASAWPHVLLTDIRMPGDDGYTLLRGAQTLATASGRSLIAAAFTSSDPAEESRAMTAGFTAFVRKPTSPQRLVDVVGRLAREAA